MKIKIIHKDYPATLSKDEVFEYKRIILLTDTKEKNEIMEILDDMEDKS